LATRPERARPDLDVAFVEPRDEVEGQVTEIWEEVLGIHPIGVKDNFFDLGGNSLLAMRLFAQIDNMCGSASSLSSFFRTPTIEQIARIVRGDKLPSPAPSEQDAEPAGSVQMKDTFWRGLRNRVCQILALYAPGFKTTRVRLHRMRGVQIGSNVSIGTSVIIETAYPQLVSIGNNVSISMRSLIVAHFRESTDRAKSSNEASVLIEDNVYIGAGAIILPNVTIGQGAVVTAGSVVSQSVPPLTMVQGNPAKPVAHCGIPLAGSTYGDFVRNLRPIES
jgi:acetyltransferase-like isoleucine patch superfamily enzyme